MKRKLKCLTTNNYVKENSVYTCTLSISEADCTQCVVYYKDLQGFIARYYSLLYLGYRFNGFVEPKLY